MSRKLFAAAGGCLVVFLAVSCGDDDVSRTDANIDVNPIIDGMFQCITPDSTACLDNVWNYCEPDGEFLRGATDDCPARGLVCVPQIGCAVCEPETRYCDGDDVVICNADGTGGDVVETCVLEEGDVCRSGECQNLCDLAIFDKSYQGCEFYAADLDNAAIGFGRDASSQQYAIVVSNPSPLPTEVWIEVNDAPYGSEPQIREVERLTILPGDLDVFRLPRREVDGSSSNQLCVPPGDGCPGSEVCVCGGGGPPCFCRVDAEASGLNDGVHSLLSSQAYRVRSQFPIIAYQFNPLDNVGVFSNDASLLLPTSAISSSYTVVGWPQTIADGDCDPSMPSCVAVDFDPTVDDEDLRAFLTILGGPDPATVDLTLGTRVVKVIGNEAQGIPAVLGAGAEVSVELGPFDVLNLETDGLNGDFTGSLIESTMPVAVFVGSEASDAPRFDTYSTRLCCADHLEEQLFGNETLGSSFMIARMPTRGASLNRAFINPDIDQVAEVNEPEWVRVVATFPGETTLVTTLPPPDDRVTLAQYESIIFRASQDFILNALDNKPVAVMQTLPSQQAVGIPNYYPGGDPAIIAIPPREQYRRDYVFLTPDQYAFDYVVITADADTQVMLDGAPLDPLRCTTSPADGIERMIGDPPPEQVIYRCQLSFPEVGRICNPEEDPECTDEMVREQVRDGEQNDGVHSILATQPVGVVIYGFDAFVSYAYAAGLNLLPIPR